MARRLILLIAVLAFVASFIAVAAPAKAAPNAATGVTATVRSRMLRLREGASTRTKVLLQLHRGDVVTVLGKAKNRRWLKVQVSTGQIGWVAAFTVKLNGAKLKDIQIVT